MFMPSSQAFGAPQQQINTKPEIHDDYVSPPKANQIEYFPHAAIGSMLRS
jgi:hypothetical protein